VRILHILDHSIPLHSGYTFRTASILREQRRLGWETFQLTSSRQTQYAGARETVDDLDFFRTPLVGDWAKAIPMVSQMMDMRLLSQRLAAVIDEIAPDILHAHSPVLNALPALSQGRKRRIPVIYEVRAFWEDAAVDHGTTHEGSMRYRVTQALETRALRQASGVTCICEGLRNDIVNRGISPEKITVIPNAVDTEKFQFGLAQDHALKARLGLSHNRVLGFVGSFYAYEGLDLLLTSLPKILATAPDIRVLLVGGGPQEDNLKARCAQLGIADKVLFTGRVDHQEVARYYGVIDILVYPRHSIRLTELVTPLKPLEAMAQGQMFIASNVGGHQELIRNGETGTLFKAGDGDDLARTALQLLEDTSRWQAMRVAARKFVETERTWARSIANYQTVYSRALDSMKR
jgi:glycogen synthase